MINTDSPDFVENPLLDLRIVSGRDLTEFSQADQAEIKRCLDLSSMAYAEIEKDKKIHKDEKKITTKEKMKTRRMVAIFIIIFLPNSFGYGAGKIRSVPKGTKR